MVRHVEKPDVRNVVDDPLLDFRIDPLPGVAIIRGVGGVQQLIDPRIARRVCVITGVEEDAE